MINEFIKHKKILKKYDVANDYIIHNSLNLHSQVFNDCEVVPVYSTDIYSESIFLNKKNYILFDIHYIKYVESFYINFKIIDSCFKQKSIDQIKTLMNTIQSDIYHFKAMINYRNSILSYNYSILSYNKIQSHSIYLHDENFKLFLELISIYTIRHEQAHSYYKKEESLLNKLHFANELNRILKKVELNKIKINKVYLKKNTQIIDNDLIMNEIKLMLYNFNYLNDDYLFEELFCDYIAFKETISVFIELYDVEGITKIELAKKITELLLIYDYISDLIRRINFNEDSKALIRHSINIEIKFSIMIDLITNGMDKEEIIELQRKIIYENNFSLLDEFQNLYFNYLLDIFIITKEEEEVYFKDVKLNITEKEAKNKRDMILQW